MNARRRDNTPPYEIMGNRPASPQASGRGPRPGMWPGMRPGAGFGAGIGGFFQSMADAWRAGASEPLTLRVPRGMAVSLLAGLLGLLVLAYWVGHSRGGSAAEKRVTAMYEPALADDGRVPPERLGGRVNVPNTGQGPGSPAVERADPRVPGSNYLILALYPQEEAQRLRAFFAERQVDVLVGPRNNKGLCQVIALNGFTREQMRDTDAAERFLTRMRALGRDWKAANEGRGDDLSSMYYGKYEPPTGR